MEPLTLSVVIPLYNEEENIPFLLQGVHEALHHVNYEIILVDDGSTDGTQTAIYQHALPMVRLVELKQNFGRTVALKVGAFHALGRFILPMYGDMRNDPQDIPRLLTEMMSGKWDMVIGRQTYHKEPFG